jgi:hypothetical protein
MNGKHIAKNDDFGFHRSRCFKNKDLTDNYFDEITAEFMKKRILSQGVVKSIAGGGENGEVILSYALSIDI